MMNGQPDDEVGVVYRALDAVFFDAGRGIAFVDDLLVAAANLGRWALPGVAAAGAL
jgi:hypothetical protein